MSKDCQLGFRDFERSMVKRETKRERFLSVMEEEVPWEELEELLQPFYGKQDRTVGRRPYPLGMMLRIHFLQQWYSLSDERMEEELIDVAVVRAFAGIDLLAGSVPDESTILAFRHLLEEKKLAKKIFKMVNRHLEDQGLLMRKGTVIDATIISAPSSTKNKNRERDPEMHQTRKGNQWFFGMKAHIGVDKDSGLIHSVLTTAANVHDLTSASELLHGQEDVVYGDAGYQGLERRSEMENKTVECRIGMRPGQRRKLSDSPDDQLQEWCERAKAHVRAKVEHAFHIMKRQFGFEKTRLRGIGKNQSKVLILAALTNLFMVRNQISSMKVA